MSDGPWSEPVDGDVVRVAVEAIGEPGQRRFRLLAVIDQDTHVVWLEKQQLQALGLALEQVLDQLPDAPPSFESGASVAGFDLDTRSQFRAGRMELGYDEAHDRLVVIAHDLEAAEAGARLTCRLTRQQARVLSAEAATVVAAGRPICPLCGNAMGPGPHVCPGQNGHLPTHFDDEDLEDES